jgi:hypothetical protein
MPSVWPNFIDELAPINTNAGVSRQKLARVCPQLGDRRGVRGTSAQRPRTIGCLWKRFFIVIALVLSTKIHAMVDALGNPLAFFLTAGQAHDLEGADALSQMQADTLLADKAWSRRP